MFIGSSSPLGAKHIWKTSAPPKVKFFFWLVMHGRCWTADRRFHHGLQDSNACIFYDQGAETMNHILLGCPFSREVWEAWFRKLHLQYTVVVQDEPAIPWWLRCRKALPKQFRRGFDSLFFLIGWSIWKERNATMREPSMECQPRRRVLRSPSRKKLTLGAWRATSTSVH